VRLILSLFLLSFPWAADAQSDIKSAPQSDVTPLSVVGQITGPDGEWDHAAFHPETRRVYVARSSGLLAVDVESEKVIADFLSGGTMHAVVPLPGGDLLTTVGTKNAAVIVDGRNGRVKATIPTGEKPDSAAYDPGSNRAYVVNAGTRDISVIDLKEQKAVGRIQIEGTLDGIAVGDGRLFVNVRDANQIAVIDLSRHQAGPRFVLDNCEEPTGLAYAPKHRLLIAACTNAKATVISVDDGKQVGEVPVGKGADAVLFDDTRGLGFVAAGGSANLAVIRVSGPKDIAVVQTVDTAEGGRTLAFDSQSGRVYVPVGRLVMPARPGRPMQQQPGSFGILVLGPPSRE
jgi:DNA-binding beta-propeller fold protein YncE